jgi:hypothetical protein
MDAPPAGNVAANATPPTGAVGTHHVGKAANRLHVTEN